MNRPSLVRIADFVGASDRVFMPAQPRKADPSKRPLRPRISVVIPALNEEETIAGVVRSVARQRVDEIIVVDNGSTDATSEQAQSAGARVVKEPRRGYGRACRAGVKAVSPETDIVVFLDGDGSDCPDLMHRLVGPIIAGTHDFVIGSRARGNCESGSLNAQQLLAGRMAGFLLGLLYGVRYTDMCPFRAIRRATLEQLGMREKTYGWNLEMQMRAAQARLRILEVPVDHRRRAGGQSKVSGTFKGTILASSRIVATFLRVARDSRVARAAPWRSAKAGR
jgi:glycosyltransferase involved in cell wall biosynthesis